MSAVFKVPSTSIKLLKNDLHVWCVVLSSKSSVISTQFEKYLSESEIYRMNRFRFDSDKARFRIARGVLRKILAQYLEILPNELNFHYTKYGKPYIKNHDLHFNISHSHNIILYAISKQYPVGIDVEFCKPDIDCLAVAEQFCSPHEYKELLQLPLNIRANRFYQYWTRKEAFVKAMGLGLYYSLKNTELNSLVGDHNYVGFFKSDHCPISRIWKILDIPLSFTEQYSAALAVETLQSSAGLLVDKSVDNPPENISYWAFEI